MTSAQPSDYVSGSPLEIARAALDPATEPTSESGCTAAKGWPPAASTTPFVTPDLAYFHGLLEAIEDMHNQPDVGTLLSAVADYGMTIIPADGIAIIKRTAGGFQPVVIREVYEPDIVGVEQVVELVAAEGGFQHVHRVDDLSQDRRWSRRGCSQDQAIAILKHRSQRTNRKVRIIADEVIQIGDLKPAPTNERDRLREPGTRSAGQRTDSCGSLRRFSVPLTMCQTRKAVAILEPWSVLRPRDFAWASASLASDSSRESRGATSGC